jgi:lactate dehydrogenase-like 2-hydroxyacid dehydrogenase
MDKEFIVHRLWTAEDADALIDELAPASRRSRAARLHGGLPGPLPRLGMVANFGVGYDNVDAAHCARRGIRVTNTPGVLDDEVADTAIGILLCLARKLVAGDRYCRDGSWLRAPMPLSVSLAGKTMGLVGLGRIGSRIAELAAAHRMKVVYHTRNPKDVPYRHYRSLENGREV